MAHMGRNLRNDDHWTPPTPPLIDAVSPSASPSPPLSICLFLESEEEEETLCFADPTRFMTDPDFCYQEFARREEDHFQVFRVQVGLIYLLISAVLLSGVHIKVQNHLDANDANATQKRF